MKKLILLSVLFCSFSLITASNKEEETSEEDVKAEGTYFSDDSVKTSSKVKTGARLVGTRVAGLALVGGGFAAAGAGLSLAIISGGAAGAALIPLLYGGSSAMLAGEGILYAAMNAAVTPLEVAIADDNLTRVTKLLAKNPKLAKLTGPIKGRLPLHFAAMKNTDVAIIKALINAYPKALRIKTESGVIPLAYAIKDKYSSTTASIKKTLGLKYNDADNHEVFEVMLQADPSCTKIQFGKESTVIGGDVNFKNTLFHKAVLVNDPYYLQALLKVDPLGATQANAFGNLPLHIAAATENKEIISILLKANPATVKAKNKKGKTPLDFAKNDKIKAMLGAKVEVSFMDRIKATASEVKSTITGSASDSTLLHKAARNGDEATITKILKKDRKAAQVKDKDGNLPLHLAAAREDGKDAVNMLLKAYEKGASSKNNAGKMPYNLAATEELNDLLTKALL